MQNVEILWGVDRVQNGCIVECWVVVEEVEITVQFVGVQFEWCEIDSLKWIIEKMKKMNELFSSKPNFLEIETCSSRCDN